MCDINYENYYRSSGEKYLDAVRKSLGKNSTNDDKLKLLKAAQHFQEQMLHGISSIADVMSIADEDTLTHETRAGLGSVVNELSILAFDCMEVMMSFNQNIETSIEEK